MKAAETSSTDLRPQAGSTNYIAAVVEADLEVGVLSKIILANEVSRGFRPTGLGLGLKIREAGGSSGPLPHADAYGLKSDMHQTLEI